MNVKEEHICRLCLKIAEFDFQRTNEIIREMFDVLLLKVNLVVSKEPIVCKDCMDILIKCFNFKSACMDIEELIVTFANDKNSTTFELKDVFEDGKNLDADISICRFCSNRSSECDSVLLRTLKKDVSFAENLQALMIEMDFDFIKNPVICTSCRQDLECYMEFVRKCLDVEEKITKFSQTKRTPSSVQIKLSEIHILELDYTQTYVIKREEDVIEHIGKAPSEVYDSELIKPEEPLDIKDEEVNSNETEMPLPKLNNTSCGLRSEMTRGTQKASQNISFTPTTADRGKCMCDTVHHCGLGNELRCNIITPEIRMGNASQTKRKGAVKKRKYNLKNTTNGLETPMFTCKLCTYRTNRNSNLIRHTLIHKDVTEVEMHKCSMCTFQTKQKVNLNRHMLIHKHITEVKMYKCSICTFQTIRKYNVYLHMFTHKKITEVEMHKCSTCTYKTKHKRSLKLHTLIHKDISEVKTHKCSTCTYKTKHKSSLNVHMLIHKNNTDVEMYKCSTCTYETKHKGSLKSHVLLHKNIKEVERYKCSTCTYETKHKRGLKTHMSIHKDISDVDTI